MRGKLAISETYRQCVDHIRKWSEDIDQVNKGLLDEVSYLGGLVEKKQGVKYEKILRLRDLKCRAEANLLVAESELEYAMDALKAMVVEMKELLEEEE